MKIMTAEKNFPITAEYRAFTYKHSNLTNPIIEHRYSLSLQIEFRGVGKHKEYAKLQVFKNGVAVPHRHAEKFAGTSIDAYTWAIFDISGIEPGDIFDVRVIDACTEMQIDQFALQAMEENVAVDKAVTTNFTKTVNVTTVWQHPPTK